MLKKAILLFLILCMLVIMVSCGGNPVIPPIDEEGNIQITDMFWDSNTKVIEITLDPFPSTWGNWTMYIDGEKLHMEGGAGNPVIRPNASLDESPTGLLVGTLPWVSPLTEVDFPCCGTIQFNIPGEGFTNEYEFNLINFGCETASEEECTQTPIPEPEGEVFFVTDTNPENDLILLAGIDGGEKIVTLGEKDGSGNPISITGALYLTGQGEGLAIEVDNNGLPARVVDSDGNKFTFENYTDSTVDISIYDFEENLIEGPLTIEIDPNDINRMQQLYQSFYSKSRWDAHNTADIFEYTSVAIGFVGCGVSIFAAVFSGGFAIPVAAIACSSAMYNAYTVSHPNDPILTNTEGTTLNITDNILNIVFINKFTPWGIAGTVSGMIGSVIEVGATKMDIIEVHNGFLLAIVNQDWYKAKGLCTEDSEAYNMVCGMEIAFANESLNSDNSSIEISQRIDDLSIVDRPIAHMYNTAEITFTAEGYDDPFVYSGEWYYGYLEEVSLNKWKKVESAILKIIGVPPLGPLPNPTLYDPGDAVDSYVEYTVSWSDESEHGAIDYFIKEDTSLDFDPDSPNYSGSWVEGTSKTFSHQVDQDTIYYYRVWSYAGNTVWSEPGSNIESITVISDPFDRLPAPTLYDPGVSVNSKMNYELSWSDESSTYGATTYYIHEDTTPDFDSSNFKWYSTNSTSKLFCKDVDSDTTYYYSVYYYSDTYNFVSEHSNTVDMIVKKEGSPVEPDGTYDLHGTGPAGGYIFYDKGSYSDGWRYLEAAPASTEWTDKRWGSFYTLIGATETGIGTGQSNTTTIVTWLNNHSETDRAAQLCDVLVYGGYSDWFLPSLDELNLMYTNLKVYGVGGFASAYYWSSSEVAEIRAWYLSFNSGLQYNYTKDNSERVRAVRAF